MPPELLAGPLAEMGLPVPLTVGLPPPEDRGFADVWSALGGELKPSIDVVVSAPISTGQQFPMGPPVTEPPLFNFGGSRRARRATNRWASPSGLAEDGDDSTGRAPSGKRETAAVGRGRRRPTGTATRLVRDCGSEADRTSRPRSTRAGEAARTASASPALRRSRTGSRCADAVG